MPIPFALEWAVEEARNAPSGEHAGVARLLGVLGVPAAFAHENWAGVLEHKWYLSERIGRDVGLQVAVVDYFENVRQFRGRHTARPGWLRRQVAAAASPVLALERTLADAFNAVRGSKLPSL